MKNKTARDIMIPVQEYPTVHVNTTLSEAITVLKETFLQDKKGVVTGHRSVLVLNNEGDLIGILTIRTILNAIRIKSSLGASLTRLFVRDVVDDNALLMNVKEVMRPVLSNYVNAEDSVVKAAGVMLDGKVNIIPVWDGDKVVGIIRSIDLMNIIGELLR